MLSELAVSSGTNVWPVEGPFRVSMNQQGPLRLFFIKKSVQNQ